ncbi:MAG TPA: hypothetical protein VJ790_23530 [Dongiaceae bacterium]|nr:hypothetical protein [Dongiaceae bacterium]
MTVRQPVVIEGTIELDGPRVLEGAMAEVQLREKAMADAPAKIVARSRMKPADGRAERIPFRLEALVEEDGDYALAAEIRCRGSETLAPGDMLTVVHHPWRYATGRRVTLPVKEIS